MNGKYDEKKKIMKKKTSIVSIMELIKSQIISMWICSLIFKIKLDLFEKDDSEK